jgi:hypothetical protein
MTVAERSAVSEVFEALLVKEKKKGEGLQAN